MFFLLILIFLMKALRSKRFLAYLSSYYATFDAKLFLLEYDESHNATESAESTKFRLFV